MYYRKAHLPGAINIPHDRVDELAPRLLPDETAAIVVYCANAPCKNSGIAAARLVELGYRDVRDYHEDKQDWIEAGLPVETRAAAAA
jgi:rhodanese-related sulfurtransferase